jgi:hypothetical protein
MKVIPFFVKVIFIDMNLQENIHRIKQMMGLYEQTSEIKAKASVEGLINFFDGPNQKVYRYKLTAKVSDNHSIDIFVKFLDDTTGDLTFLNPQTDEVESQQIPVDQLFKIKEDVSKKRDINNIFSFKKFTKTIEINLVFVEEKRIQFVK